MDKVQNIIQNFRATRRMSLMRFALSAKAARWLLSLKEKYSTAAKSPNLQRDRVVPHQQK